jgi:hypothetical protein
VTASLETFEAWQRVKQSTPREQFLVTYRHPFLVRQKLRRTSASGTPVVINDDWTERVSFHTDVVDPGQVLTPAPAGRLRGARVVAVVKAPGNPFPDRISVGRAQNCDIVLRDASISKLHAHFKVLGPGQAELTDTKSANGTRINGRPLAPGHTLLVGGGDTLIFGAVAVQFLDPMRLWELL